jgi:carbonic anhydrase
MWDSPNDDLNIIFENNIKWRDEQLSKDPLYFDKLAVGQKPKYLLIGCSDSRVGAQQIMGLDQGQIFVHRNIANLVVTCDLNLLSVIFYSVNVLKVQEIIVLVSTYT